MNTASLNEGFIYSSNWMALVSPNRMNFKVWMKRGVEGWVGDPLLLRETISLTGAISPSFDPISVLMGPNGAQS
jgi:hypothetical protein